LEDKSGRPAIIEIPCGRGRVLVFEPSIERYYTGALAAESATASQASALFENIVHYVRRPARK